MNKNPFTQEEQNIMDSLLKAHSEFTKLEQSHPSELQDWIYSFHQLQGLLIQRVVRRYYPNIFYSSNKKLERHLPKRPPEPPSTEIRKK